MPLANGAAPLGSAGTTKGPPAMTAIILTATIDDLQGLSIRRGVTPGSWCCPGAHQYATTYGCAVSAQYLAIEKRVYGLA
jgi:hypothetical protein